ncbi:MAG: hypothetical protein AB1453_05060 [Chloroflexota bacterium]|jgi:hypothetical protein
MIKLFKRDKSSATVPPRFDVVIEAVRFTPDGSLQTARIYERRGPVWSDRLLIGRADLIRRIRKGEKVVIGARKPYLANTFEAFAAVRLAQNDDKEVLTSMVENDHSDSLPQAPRF